MYSYILNLFNFHVSVTMHPIHTFWQDIHVKFNFNVLICQILYQVKITLEMLNADDIDNINLATLIWKFYYFFKHYIVLMFFKLRGNDVNTNNTLCI